MAKSKNDNGPRPKVATLSGGGASAKLGDFLEAGGPSAKPPTSGRRN